MARVIKQHDERLNEILDAARELFAEQGFDETSVNDILRKVGIAKGTFYHYFAHKEELLEHLVTRWVDAILPLAEQIVEDPGLGALDKLGRFLLVTGDYRLVSKRVLESMGRAIFSDSNLLTRHKLIRRNVEIFSPLVARVIRQGMEEGVFNTAYPEEAAEMILLTSRDLKERLGPRMFDYEDDAEVQESLKRTFRFWADLVERMLGAPAGSVTEVVDAYLADYLQGERDEAVA